MTGKDLEILIASCNLTVVDAAKIIGVSRQTLYGLLNRSELKEKDVLLVGQKLKPYINFTNQDLFNNLAAEPTSAFQKSSELKQIPFSEYMEADYLSIEAQAGYLDSLEINVNPKLDKMLIPKEFEKGNYLVVEISGDSMNDGTVRAIQDGDRLLCKELDKAHWINKLHFNQYLFVIMGRDGIVCKQITKHDVAAGVITCHSWNPTYKDYTVSLADVYKLLYVKKIVERRIIF